MTSRRGSSAISSSAMNWVGGARSRIRQQSDKKRQKEFFAKQKLRRDTALCHIPGDQSPEGRGSKPISLDLLSLQIVQHASEASGRKEDAPCRMPYRQNLDLSGTRAGKLAGNGPWRTQDLSLPMSPIAQPSALELMDSSLYDELPIDQKAKAPPLPTALRGHRTGLHNLPPPRATSTAVRDPTNGRQEHTVPPFSSPLEGSRADLNMSRLSTEAVLPRKRQLAVRQRSKSSVSKVPSLPCNSFVRLSKNSVTSNLTAHEQTPPKKPTLQQERSAFLAVAVDGSRGNAGRLKGAHPQLGPHQRQRRHMLGAQQMAPPYVGLCDGDMPETHQRNARTASAEVLTDCKMHVPYPTTCSLSSFEKMMMAVKIDAPAGRPDLVQESTPITAVNPSGQEHRQKKESSWFNFISHMEELPAPSSRRQQQQRQPKPAPVDSAHYAYLMAGNSREEHESDADHASTDIGNMMARTHRKQGKEQLAYCSALEELLELGEDLNSSGEETTEDPICLPVLEVEKRSSFHDKRVIPVSLCEGFSTLPSMASREGVTMHTQASHLESNEASGVVSKDGGDSEDLHCYEAMLARGALSPPAAGSGQGVAASLSDIVFASASGNNFISEIRLENPLHQKMNDHTVPPTAKGYRLSQSEPQLEDSQFESVVYVADHAKKHIGRTNGVTEQPLGEPNQQETPGAVCKAIQTEGTTIRIDTSLEIMAELQKTGGKAAHESHGTQTETMQTNESAVQVDPAVMATTSPLPVGFTATATQTSANTAEQDPSEFSQLSADLVGWIVRQEVNQMSKATRDTFACKLKDLRGRIEQAENSLIWLSILSKLSSMDKIEQ